MSELPKVTCPAGIDAYVVTGYEPMRKLLRDNTASSRAASSMHAQPGSDFAAPIDPGNIIQQDGDAHVRLRRLTTPEFTVAGARALRPFLRRIINEHIDAMLAKDGPVDLVADFALPIPMLVICELLAVPYADRVVFGEHAAMLVDTDVSPELQAQHLQGLMGYLHGLISERMAAPSEEDMLGRIILRSRAAGAPVTQEEMGMLGLILLVAGHETTANQIALSVLALLRNPSQLAALRAEPAKIETAVEELLRYLSIIQFGLLRYTTEPIEVDGRRIEAGQWVVNALSTANRDKTVFADPDRIDIDRQAANHLAFGFGRHQCLGQQLARVELQEALNGLLARVPEMRLAVPFEEVPFKDGNIIYGLRSLPLLMNGSR